jgi:hypothetical protein
MTAILTTSVMALSAITPAALFSFLGIEKYGSKHKFAWNIKPSGFSIDLYRADFERYVQKHFQSQLEKQVSFMIGEKQRYGYIRQVDHNKFTYFINSKRI